MTNFSEFRALRKELFWGEYLCQITCIYIYTFISLHLLLSSYYICNIIYIVIFFF